MEEIDIWRSAALLLKQHGKDAELQAERHMRAMITRGDPEGEAVWKPILQATEKLRAMNSPASAVH